MTEYVVTVTRTANWQELHTDLTTADTTVEHVPARAVEVLNLRPSNTRNTHYNLTANEAADLRQDLRVQAVTPTAGRAEEPCAVQLGNFNKGDAVNGQQDNWGLIRHSAATNVYGTSQNDPGIDYNYVLDGTGVDIVIMDTGIQTSHPEFDDRNGNSRVVELDWSQYNSVEAIGELSNYYRDVNGHGTYVASITAGKTFGWAKNASIYLLKMLGTDEGRISREQAFDVLLDWHNSKNNGRPTVVNMSWGMVRYFNVESSPVMLLNENASQTVGEITGGNYRGADHSEVAYSNLAQYGVIGSNIGGDRIMMPSREPDVDADVEQLVDAGMLVCISAGNFGMKQDVNGGADYNNRLTYTLDGSTVEEYYYHRGASPTLETNEFLNVGALSANSYSSTEDQRAEFSNAGPAVNVFAAGDNVIGAVSSTYTLNQARSEYYYESGVGFQLKLSGTSVAAPQVAGMCACIWQAHPTWTAQTVINYVLNNSTATVYTTGQDNDYQVTNSLLGSTAGVAYFPLTGVGYFRISVV